MSFEQELENIRFIDQRNNGKARCEIGWNWCPPPLPDYDLWYVLNGRGVMQINDGLPVPIRSGDCFLLRPGDRPQAEQDIHHRLQVIFIHFDLVPQPNEILPQRCTNIRDRYHFEWMLNRLLELSRRSPLYGEEEFNFILKQVFLELHRRQREAAMTEPSLQDKHSQLVDRVMSLIQENPASRMTLEGLAAQVELSPEYLSKIFKKTAGVPLRQFMTEARLERAMHLLKETSMNVSQVAEALGYANVYLFSKQFKKHYDHPPSHYKFRGIAQKPHR